MRERDWHRSQVIEELADGRLVVTLNVCNDHPLRAWVLGFGPAPRVISPVSLAQEIFDAAGETRRYLGTPPNRRVEMLTRRAC